LKVPMEVGVSHQWCS